MTFYLHHMVIFGVLGLLAVCVLGIVAYLSKDASMCGGCTHNCYQGRNCDCVVGKGDQ